MGTVDIERDFPQRLHGVGMEPHAVPAAKLPDLLDRLQHAGLVVGGHDADQNRLGSKGIVEAVEIDEAVALNRKIRYFAAKLLQMLAGIKHRLVLGHGGYCSVCPGAARPAGSLLPPAFAPR